VLWELREGPLAFRPLQERCDGMSSSVLNQRLSELKAAGVIERAKDGYRLSAEGRQMLPTLADLNAWAERWAERSQAR
jgi:DNA-binding HxlR family transcriptional regulator